MIGHAVLGRESRFKSISTKPVLITLRDAALITAVTLVATIIALWIYFTITKTADRDYGVRNVIMLTMAAQFLYEYAGVNNMLAESSIRYAKGSALAKYTSRRDALLYKNLYKLLSDGHDTPEVRANFKLLNIVLTHPNLVGDVADYKRGSRTLEDLRRVHPSEPLDELLGLETSADLSHLSDRITEGEMRAIMLHGFMGVV